MRSVTGFDADVHGPAVLQEWETECGVPSGTPTDQLGQNTPNPHLSINKSDGQHERAREDQGAVIERKCWCPGNILAPINIYQLRRVTGNVRHLGPPAFSLMSHWGLQRHSDPSRPP